MKIISTYIDIADFINLSNFISNLLDFELNSNEIEILKRNAFDGNFEFSSKNGEEIILLKSFEDEDHLSVEIKCEMKFYFPLEYKTSNEYYLEQNEIQITPLEIVENNELMIAKGSFLEENIDLFLNKCAEWAEYQYSDLDFDAIRFGINSENNFEYMFLGKYNFNFSLLKKENYINFEVEFPSSFSIEFQYFYDFINQFICKKLNRY